MNILKSCVCLWILVLRIDSILPSSLTEPTELEEETVDRNIVIKMKPGATKTDLDEILRKHPRFKLVKQVQLLGETYYDLTLDESYGPAQFSDQRAGLKNDDDDVQMIKQDTNVEYAAVNHKMIISTHAADPEMDLTWYLTGTTPKYSMNIDRVWAMGYTGKGRIVAVTDTLFQTDHTDLTNIDISNSYDYVNDDNDPNTNNTRVRHGTEVAGVVGATKGNGECTAGVAYNVSIQALGILPGSSGGSITDLDMARTLSHNTATVDIYSNSWGTTSRYAFAGYGTLTMTALKSGADNGRNGKGSVYVFAAGNDGPNGNSGNSELRTSIYTIIISSVGYSSTTAYSQIGSNIMAVAYGGDWRDKQIPVPLPMNYCNKRGVSGTSFSAPIASAIIALALEANNVLTWRDIQHLIIRTSKPHRFTDDYFPKYKWRRNASNLKFHPKMGYGLMDALAMVKKAKSWKTVPEMITCTSQNSTADSTTTDSKYLIDRSVVTRQGCAIRYLEHVLVTVEVGYSDDRGSIEIELKSPKRTKSPILTQRPVDAYYYRNNGTFTWTFDSLHFWGENPRGSWMLMTNSINRFIEVGPVTWYLTLYGTATNPMRQRG